MMNNSRGPVRTQKMSTKKMSNSKMSTQKMSNLHGCYTDEKKYKRINVDKSKSKRVDANACSTDERKSKRFSAFVCSMGKSKSKIVHRYIHFVNYF